MKAKVNNTPQSTTMSAPQTTTPDSIQPVNTSTLPLDNIETAETTQTTDTSPSTVSILSSASKPADESTDSPKPQRVTTKQRKLDFEEYKAAFLTPKILTDRKQTSISKQLLDRITWLVRHLGYNESTVSGFIDSVLQQHIDDYYADHEIWRKL